MKKLGLLGRKKGMTQIFDEDGMCIPVTLFEVGPCTVVQKKTLKCDGYDAIQLGFGTMKDKRLHKPLKGHFQKRNVGPLAHLKEFRVSDPENFQVGQNMMVKAFKVGDIVDIQGFTKGRGFQGVMKKEGKHGGPDAHGSDFHRRPGSIGMRTWPGRVLKNMGLPGRMGAHRITISHLTVTDVKADENLLILKGSVPGPREGLVVIYCKEKNFETRFKEE